MNHSSNNHKIGIVSGVGPLAGADVLQRVFVYSASNYGAHEDDEYPDLVLLNKGISGVDYTATLDETFRQGIISMVAEIQSMGATIIGIACNTAHAFLDDIHLEEDVTIINLITAVAERASNQDVTYGLLTSHGTKNGRLYHDALDAHGVNYTETTDEQQAKIDYAIDRVMAHDAKTAGEAIEEVIMQMKKSGITHFIAGCTELPIALQAADLGDISCITSNQILAEELVDTYMNQ